MFLVVVFAIDLHQEINASRAIGDEEPCCRGYTQKALFSDEFLYRIIGFETFQKPWTRLTLPQRHASRLALPGCHCSVSRNLGTTTSSSEPIGGKRRDSFREKPLGLPLLREQYCRGTKNGSEARERQPLTRNRKTNGAKGPLEEEEETRPRTVIEPVRL